jgi:hypothetical protein
MSNLKDIFYHVPLLSSSCHFSSFKCPFCPFWVKPSFASKLVSHFMGKHVGTKLGQRSVLVATVGPPGAQFTHAIFPQFEGTDLDDELILRNFRSSVRYLTSSCFVTLPYVKVVHSVVASFYLCPFCNVVEREKTTLEKHLYVHLTLKFVG